MKDSWSKIDKDFKKDEFIKALKTDKYLKDKVNISIKYRDSIKPLVQNLFKILCIEFLFEPERQLWTLN